jgi:CcmD family protein
MRKTVLSRNTRAKLVFAALAFCLGTIVAIGPAAAAQQQPPPPKTAAQDGFVPLKDLPPEDRLPAAPLLVAAYSIAWAALLFYVWSVWRRLARVERELAVLRLRVDRGERPGTRP